MSKIKHLNIITLGSSKVGKTSILKRYIDNEYHEEQLSTFGIEHNFRYFKFNEEKVKIDYVDTAGQEAFRSIASNYLKKADGVILTFDITQRDSFELVGNWLDDLEKNNNKNNIGIILIGNKNDLEEQRQVKKEEGENMANNIKCEYMEVSAKTGDNINEALDEIAKITYENYKSNPLEESNSFNLDKYRRKSIFKEKKKKSKSKCC